MLEKKPAPFELDISAASIKDTERQISELKLEVFECEKEILATEDELAMAQESGSPEDIAELTKHVEEIDELTQHFKGFAERLNQLLQKELRLIGQYRNLHKT